MNIGLNVGASYFRFNKSHPYVCPNHSRISVSPLISRGRDIPWPDDAPILVAKEHDILVGFEILLERFKGNPADGIFEFWTQHWNGDSRDAEWPWIHWTFHDVTWEGGCGTCIVKRDRPINPDLGKATGWQYAKKVPRI